MTTKQPKLKLNYAQLDRDKIVAQVEEHFKTSGFGKLIDSKLVSFLVDAFGATAEFIIYYLERRAEEGFFATAQLRSSVIIGSRSLGYSIRRPSPATPTLQIVLKGNAGLPTADYTGKIMQFPIGMKMVRNGIPFVLNDTYTYKFKTEDTPTYPTWTKALVFATREADGTLLLRDNTELSLFAETDRIDIMGIQGETREVVINFAENPISGQIFQRYDIDDPEFSDYFGVNDPRAYNSTTGLWSPSSGFTQVSVCHAEDPAYDESSLYKIDRRSLVNHETLYRDTYDKLYDDEQNLVEDSIPKVCVIRTSKSGGVEVMFGDGLVSEMPKSDQLIRIRYLATKGTTANEVGSRGTQVNIVNPVYASMPSLLDVSNIVTIVLGTNILGGADIEDIESIRVNAPAIYNSLDRLVGLGDYVAFLSSLVSPIRVSHAIAWGEQEEVQQGGYRANKRYSNHVYYSVLGNLYEKTSDGRYVPKNLIRGTVQSGTVNTLNENGLLEGFDYDQYSEQAYFNILVADRVVSMRNYERLLYEEFFNRANISTYTEEQVEWANRFPLGHPVAQLTAMLEKRGQLTTKPRYVTPIIQEFKLSGKIVVRDFADLENVRNDVEASIFAFLDANVNYNTPVLLSHINSIAKSNPDVARADFKFIPVASDGMVINDWMTEPEMMSQVPYEYDRFLSLQNGAWPDVAINQFTVIPDSDGKLTIDGKYTIGNMYELVGMKIRLSQDGGVTYNYAEVESVEPTQAQPRWYARGLVSETSVVNMLNDQWYVLNGSIPSGFPVDNSPNTSRDLVRKRWAQVYVPPPALPWPAGYTHDAYQWKVIYDFTTPQANDVVNIAPSSGQAMRWWVFTGSAWSSVAYDAHAPIRIIFASDTAGLGSNKSLIAEVVTNMKAVYDGLGFDPKVYLVEAFQTAISKEVKRLFDVVHHKYCSCPPDAVPTPPSSSDPVAEACTPFGMRDHIYAPYQTDRGDCHENTNAITWDDWSKSYYRPRYESFTRCGQLFLMNDGNPISKDQWSNGQYNAGLDITEFERVTALGAPWRLGAPPKDEANEAWVTESTMHHRIGGINERWFYQTLMRNVIVELRAIAKKKSESVASSFYTTDRTILDLFLNEFGSDGSAFSLSAIQGQITSLLASSAYIEDVDAVTNVEKFISSKSFRGLMLKLHNGITQSIRSGMIDTDGNITNFSMRNEIVQIKSALEFRYG